MPDCSITHCVGKRRRSKMKTVCPSADSCTNLPLIGSHESVRQSQDMLVKRRPRDRAQVLEALHSVSVSHGCVQSPCPDLTPAVILSVAGAAYWVGTNVPQPLPTTS